MSIRDRERRFGNICPIEVKPASRIGDMRIVKAVKASGRKLASCHSSQLSYVTDKLVRFGGLCSTNAAMCSGVHAAGGRTIEVRLEHLLSTLRPEGVRAPRRFCSN